MITFDSRVRPHTAASSWFSEPRAIPLAGKHHHPGFELIAAAMEHSALLVEQADRFSAHGFAYDQYARSHTYNPVYGVTRNTYDQSRSAGGAAAALLWGSHFVCSFRTNFGRVPADARDVGLPSSAL